MSLMRAASMSACEPITAGVIGMGLGEEHVVDLLVADVVGSAFALTALVADDVTLVGKFDAVEAF